MKKVPYNAGKITGSGKSILGPFNTDCKFTRDLRYVIFCPLELRHQILGKAIEIISDSHYWSTRQKTTNTTLSIRSKMYLAPKFQPNFEICINICKWKLLVKFVAILGIDYLKIAHLSNLV
jgi:hypothetical protein